MQFNHEIHHRRSIRLKDYDYSQAGAYFITICTKEKECLFGEIHNGEMKLNEAGKMVLHVWNKLTVKYSGVEIDEYIVMPNHMHGIVLIVGAGPRACPVSIAGQQHEDGQPQKTGQPQGVAPTLSLPDIVHRLKSFTTAQYRLGVTQNNWRQFPDKLWQRNYYEHIIRNEIELNKIREYIKNNPLNWSEDENYSGKL